MHRVNAGYTLLARLAPDRIEAAAALLAELAADPARLPFDRSETTHFATLTILPAQRFRDEELPATLLLATSFCGPTDVHVKELLRLMGDELRGVFACCSGFVAGCSDHELEEFVLEHRCGDTFYSGMQDLSPADVSRHKQLRTAIETFVDERQANGGFTGDAVATQRAIQDHVRAQPALAWAQDSFAPPPGTFMARYWRSMIVGAFVIPFLALLVIGPPLCFVLECATLGTIVKCAWIAFGVIIALLGGLVLSIREAESEQTYVAGRQPDAHVRMLAATQNRPVINEFTVVGPIKEEGSLRPLFLRLSLWIVARVAEGIPWSPLAGLRTGINIPTVATARWIAADRGRRLIFISNYTNSAEPYVRDFIDVHDGAMRINLTFGFGGGYPKTRWVMFDGALTDPNGFIYVVTAGQHPTAYWYGPHRDMSIDNIKINRDIREGLFADHDEDQAKAWLALL